MPERCDAVEPLLSAYLDEELPPTERDRVAQHLARCDACASDVEALRAVRSLARSLPVRRVPEDMPLVARPPARAPVLARAGLVAAVAAGLLTGAAFTLGGQETVDAPMIAVPMDVFVADHVVRAVQAPASAPVTVGTRP